MSASEDDRKEYHTFSIPCGQIFFEDMLHDSFEAILTSFQSQNIRTFTVYGEKEIFCNC